MSSRRRIKLVIGEKQTQAIITALALLETENEVTLGNYQNMLEWDTPDKDQVKTDIVRIKTESSTAQDLRTKLVRMLEQEGK